MFFQSIFQMMSPGTDLNINLRRVDNHLIVAVMPKRTGLKEETGQLIIPLVLSGTPEELDAEFLRQVTTPLQKVQGILTNLEAFEKQAEAVATQRKTTNSANTKETKEAREKREKMEKLLKRAEEAFTAGKYSEAVTCFKQAKVLADVTRQKDIEARIQEAQKKSSQGSLFAEEISQTQPVQQQPSPRQQPTPQPATQPLSQPLPQPRIMQPQPTSQAYRTKMPQPQPVYGQYYQNPVNHIQPQPAETLFFDKDDENDKEILREDPYAEYLDFPNEYRMKDEAQMDLVYC